MQENPLWPVTIRFPKLERDIFVDVAIIGGGIAGISCAYFLQKAGYNIAVLEQDEVGSAASGASSGILFYGSGTGFTEALSLFGDVQANLLWKETEQTINEMVNLIRDENIECGFRHPGAIMAAQNEEEEEALTKEHKALATIGIKTEITDSGEIRKFFPRREFRQGLVFDICTQIQPAVFAAGLAHKNKIPVFEYSPMVSFSEEPSSVVVKTPQATVRCEKMLVATNLQPFFGLEKQFRIESSALIASQLMDGELMKSVWPQEKIIWTMDEKYDIIYPQGGRAILEVYVLKNVKEKISRYYPGVNFTIDAQWGDSWSKTDDWLPIIGKVRSNIYCAVAMGDQGIVMGFTAGRKAPLMVEDKPEDFLNLVSPARFGRSIVA